MQEGGGRLQNGSTVGRTSNRLKLVESDENGKVTRERTTEMDPYRELELYLAKVKVSLYDSYIFISRLIARNYQTLKNHKILRNRGTLAIIELL